MRTALLAANVPTDIVAVDGDAEASRIRELNDLPAGLTRVNVDPTKTCTWGFSVFQQQDERMITAGHCDEINHRYPFITTVFPFVLEQNAGNVDTQVHDIPGGHTGDNRIAMNQGASTREITARATYASMDINDTACKEGRITGYTCGTITSVTDTQGGGSGGQVIRVEGPNLHAEHGDSGGPFIFGQTALGQTESGNAQEPPNNVTLFTAVEFAEDALAFIVQTK